MRVRKNIARRTARGKVLADAVCSAQRIRRRDVVCNVGKYETVRFSEKCPKWVARLWSFTGDWSFTGAL